MESREIRPEKITKPFQMLAAPLVGLIILEGELLLASGQSYETKWLAAMYGICAMLIIPLFLLLIFLLQTRFRPEMQEDKYYAEWLTNSYNKQLKEEITYIKVGKKGDTIRWQE